MSTVVAMLVPYDDSNDDEVQEVSAPSGYACKEKKTRIRVPWSEASLLCLLQTAAFRGQRTSAPSHRVSSLLHQTCNLIGKLCKHSDDFYSQILQLGLLPLLVQRCADPDGSVRKFACFAVSIHLLYVSIHLLYAAWEC